MMIHDPHHVAHLAAIMLSSRPEPEAHHIKASVKAARSVLDEAFRLAEADKAAAEAPDTAEGADKPSVADQH